VSILHDVLTALLSGITTYKPGTKEIQWQCIYGTPITIEVIDAETESYVERCYYENGKLHSEHNYQNESKHGLCKAWYHNGQLMYEYNYQNGVLQ